MNCPKCNAVVSDTAKFCNVCGEVINNAPKQEAKNNESQVVNNAAKVENKKPFPLIPVIAGGAGGLLLIIIIIVLALTHKPKVDLGKYVTVDFDGYDTIGTATVNFDEEAFMEDFGSRIKFTSQGRRASALSHGEVGNAAEDLIRRQVDITLSETNRLSNGDVVTVDWNINDETVEKYFKVNLVYEQMDFEVVGLDRADVVDPFDDLEVTFTGLSGRGDIQYEYTGDLDISFSPSSSNSLENGDEIVMRATYGWGDIKEDTFIEDGIIIENTSKEYTVSGLSEYVTDASQVTDEALAEMMSQINDINLSNTSVWSSDVKYNECVFTGAYLLSNKTNNSNYIYVICNISATIDDKHGETPVNYFYEVRFDNLTVDADGNVTVDVNSYSTYYGNAHYSCNEGFMDGWNYEYNFKGFTSIDSFYQEKVVGETANYNITSINF